MHEALETTWSLSGLYVSSLTPITNIGAAAQAYMLFMKSSMLIVTLLLLQLTGLETYHLLMGLR